MILYEFTEHDLDKKIGWFGNRYLEMWQPWLKYAVGNPLRADL